MRRSVAGRHGSALSSGISRTSNFLERRSRPAFPTSKSRFSETESLVGQEAAAAKRLLASKVALKCQEIVKFPVSREFGWRQVRSALDRQPGSPDVRCQLEPRTWLSGSRLLNVRRLLSRIHRLARGFCRRLTALIQPQGRISSGCGGAGGSGCGLSGLDPDT